MPTYDPNEKPQIDPAMLDRAKKLNMHIIQVVCDDSDTKLHSGSAVTFMMMTPFLPHVGDFLLTDDKIRFQVQFVMFHLSRPPEEPPAFVPHIYAIPAPPKLPH